MYESCLTPAESDALRWQKDMFISWQINTSNFSFSPSIFDGSIQAEAL